MSILQKEMDKMDMERKAREAEEKKLAAFTSDFLHEHVSQDEIAMVRRLVQNAVKDGKFEAMVYSFPSDLCTDRGRAINNYDPNWPATLQGKAREFFERYEKPREAARVQAEGDGHQLPGRRARRHRPLPELGAAGRVTLGRAALRPKVVCMDSIRVPYAFHMQSIPGKRLLFRPLSLAGLRTPSAPRSARSGRRRSRRGASGACRASARRT